jgi:hypothetical protein
MKAALRALGLRQSSSASPSMVTWYTRSKPVFKVEHEEPAGICVSICTFVPAASTNPDAACCWYKSTNTHAYRLYRQPGASTCTCVWLSLYVYMSFIYHTNVCLYNSYRIFFTTRYLPIEISISVPINVCSYVSCSY